MGQGTDARIAKFQRRAGITPATGKYLDSLDRMSKAAYELIQILQLEKAGIRDGDGQWHGSDPVGGIVRELSELEHLTMELWKKSSA